MNDTTKPRVGAGNIYVKFGETEYALVPTYAAMSSISRLSGGIRGAMDGVIKMEMDVIVRVIQFGLGAKVVKELGGANKLPELIYEAGLTDSTGEFAGKCIEYLSVLSNGGRPLTPTDPNAEPDEDRPQ